MPNDDQLITDPTTVKDAFAPMMPLTDRDTVEATFEQIRTITDDVVLCPHCWHQCVLTGDGAIWHCTFCGRDHTTAEILAARQQAAPGEAERENESEGNDDA